MPRVLANTIPGGNRMKALSKALVLLLALSSPVGAGEPPYSGPQAGEKTTPFRVLDVTGPNSGKTVDYVTEFAGAPTVLVFYHGLERSLLPLARVIDQYGAEKAPSIRTLHVFLTDDRLALEQRLPLVKQSVKFRAPMVISVDGIEGPGNYGLNKQCLLTILVAKGDRVLANFGLVQPGIADAPKVIAAMAKAVGDANPPTAEQLSARSGEAAGGGRPAAARPQAPARPALVDLSRFDLNTPEGLKEAVRALVTEVNSLRKDLAELRAAPGNPRAAAANPPARPNAGGAPLPGAAPTDAKLVGMLRSFIQLSNDNAAVDRVLKEVAEYVKGNADLTRQAVDGWTRVLFLKYGTEYAQTTGKQFVEQLRK